MNNQQPLVSVIVPVYNSENFLSECIHSVLTQSFSNIELLLIDDGSTDKSAAICDSAAKNDLRVIVFHQKNSGVSSARNKGIECSSGKYLMFLDSDDILPEKCIEVLLSKLEFYKADIVAGLTTRGVPQEKCEIWEGKKGLEESLKDNPYMYSAWGKLYRTEFVGDTRFRNEYRINEDSFFVFELLCKQPKFVALDDIVYDYRISPESATRSHFSDKFFDIVLVSEKKYQIISELFPEYSDLAENMILKAQMNLLRTLLLRTNREYIIKERELVRSIQENSRFYISCTKHDDLFFFIIKNKLIWLYKCWRVIRDKR